MTENTPSAKMCMWLCGYNYIAINWMEILYVKRKRFTVITCVSVCVHVCGVVHMQPVENGSHATVLLNK